MRGRVLSTIRRDRVKLRVIRCAESYEVRVTVGGKPKPKYTYETDNTSDAFDTANDMAERLHRKYGGL